MRELCCFLCQIFVWPHRTSRPMCLCWRVCITLVILRVTWHVMTWGWHVTINDWSCDTEKWLSNSGLLWGPPLYWLWKCRGVEGCFRGKEVIQIYSVSGNDEAFRTYKAHHKASGNCIVTIPQYHSSTPLQSSKWFSLSDHWVLF